jgi:hypothetical protein
MRTRPLNVVRPDLTNASSERIPAAERSRDRRKGPPRIFGESGHSRLNPSESQPSPDQDSLPAANIGATGRSRHRVSGAKSPKIAASPRTPAASPKAAP